MDCPFVHYTVVDLIRLAKPHAPRPKPGYDGNLYVFDTVEFLFNDIVF